MTENTLNIIHLNEDLFTDPEKKKASIERRKSFENEIEFQGIQEVKVWDAIYNEISPLTGCSQSHKAIVREAKEKGLNMCLICEDDIKFTSFGSYQYFIDTIPESFDIYLGVSYSFSYENYYKDGIVRGYFDSLTLYAIHKRFFDDFLALPENIHLDIAVSNLINEKEIRIAQPFVCTQLDGYSFNAKKVREYGWRLQNKPLFGI